MMEEDCEVSRPRLQQVYTLERATLSINLTEREREKLISRVCISIPGIFRKLYIKVNNKFVSLFSNLNVHIDEDHTTSNQLFIQLVYQLLRNISLDTCSC